MVEFAIVMPFVLVPLFFGVTDFAFFLHNHQITSHVAREGARYAATIPEFPLEPNRIETYAEYDLVKDKPVGWLFARIVRLWFFNRTEAEGYSTILQEDPAFESTKPGHPKMFVECKQDPVTNDYNIVLTVYAKYKPLTLGIAQRFFAGVGIPFSVTETVPYLVGNCPSP